MKLIESLVESQVAEHGQPLVSLPLPSPPTAFLKRMIELVSDRITAVWPLKDYVAVNPLEGFAGYTPLAVQKYLRLLSRIEILPSWEVLQESYRAEQWSCEDIDAAVEAIVGEACVDRQLLIENLLGCVQAPRVQGPKSTPVLRLHSQLASNSDRPYVEAIRDAIGQWCASYFDDQVAIWRNPHSGLGLWNGWRRALPRPQCGDCGSRLTQIASELPAGPVEAIDECLQRLGVPVALWSDYLYAVVLDQPGWFAWLKYQDRVGSANAADQTGFSQLLAIRLAYEVAAAEVLGYRIEWQLILKAFDRSALQTPVQALALNDDDLLRSLALTASEHAASRQLLARLHVHGSKRPNPEIQAVFCIDVRSERLRRNLETNNAAIQTYGFAGFFGVPLEYLPLGSQESRNQLPVLLQPKVQLSEVPVAESGELATPEQLTEELVRHKTASQLSEWWRRFRSSALSGFAYVEMVGGAYAPLLVANTFAKKTQTSQEASPWSSAHRNAQTKVVWPDFSDASAAAAAADMAAGILKNLGIQQFADLVLLCGHEASCVNNPLAASLNCGACGGHSGAVNAQVAVDLLNNPTIRRLLRSRGWELPHSCWFIAGVHNTTTDEVRLVGTARVPDHVRQRIERLRTDLDEAAISCRQERLAVSSDDRSWDDRSRDWSEVRPEWGLAGNAYFIAGPSSLTESLDLAGTAFLHHYDAGVDSDNSILELVMTAPMVVAHWINMQYFASSVAPATYGSGRKTIHNVVGGFGVLSGNDTDLMTGLAYESLCDGDTAIHKPLRLTAIIAADRTAVDWVLSRHPKLNDLVTNGWLHLAVIEDTRFHRRIGSNWIEDSDRRLNDENSEDVGSNARRAADRHRVFQNAFTD